MVDFKILSYEEEKKLTIEERKKYYINLKNYLSSLKYSSTKHTYLNFCESLNKKIIRCIIDKIKGYELFVENQEIIPNSPVIFASSHQDFNDHFNIVLSIPSHTIILNSNKVPNVVKLAMNLNGIEYVDRENSQDKFCSKINLMRYLANGKSIVVFPEGTFNCSPNKLILPIHGGVIDMAKKMQVPIVPVVQEYIYDNSKLDGKNRVVSCTVRFGMPLYVSFYDDEKEKKDELRDSLASIRYDLILKKDVFSRKVISNYEYISFLLSRLHTMDLMGVNYELEKNTIYGSGDEFYKYFPVNAVVNSDDFCMLSNSNKRKLNKLI